MNLERYEYSKKETYKDYLFYSHGPKGCIKKAVRFGLIPVKAGLCYNLSFGDWDEKKNDIDDKSVTNNGDAEKVLGTVAAIVVDFTALFNEAMVIATGSTLARTRRYQIGINKMWDEIEEIFDVYGRIGDLWEPFQKNINYAAFAIRRKDFVILEEQNEKYMTSSQKNKIKTIAYDYTALEERPYIKGEAPAVDKKMERVMKILEECPIPEEFFKQNRR